VGNPAGSPQHQAGNPPPRPRPRQVLSKSPTVTETDKFVSEMRRKTPKPVSGKWIAAAAVFLQQIKFLPLVYLMISTRRHNVGKVGGACVLLARRPTYCKLISTSAGERPACRQALPEHTPHVCPVDFKCAGL
jgi:hypothetical protein